MKAILRIPAIAVFAAGLASSVSAAPHGKGSVVFKGASTGKEIQKLKPVDRLR
jgi:hypothetical protein